MKQIYSELKQYLSRYTEHACPDNYFEAWKLLFKEGKEVIKNSKQILITAYNDMLEEREVSTQNQFNAQRRKYNDN